MWQNRLGPKKTSYEAYEIMVIIQIAIPNVAKNKCILILILIMEILLRLNKYSFKNNFTVDRTNHQYYFFK